MDNAITKKVQNRICKRKQRGIYDTIPEEPDANELFAIQKCAVYLYRVLDIYQGLDTDFIRLLEWVLRDDIGEFIKYLISVLDPVKHEALITDAQDVLTNVTDNYDIAHLVDRIFRDWHKKDLYTLKQVTKNLLLKTADNPVGKGKSDIEKKVYSLRRMFKLSSDEQEFYTLIFIISSYRLPEDFFNDTLHCYSYSSRRCLAQMLNINQSELNKVLEGTLSRIGVIKIEKNTIAVDDEFINTSADVFKKGLFAKVPDCPLPLDAHLIPQETTNHILNLLKAKPEKTATHLLLHGAAGTGKSSYARGIVRELGIPAYAVLTGDKNTSSQRRAGIIACLNMTNSSGVGSIIIVDESDNLLNTQNSWMSRGETQDKGFLNHLLEQPGVRMLWICNRLDEVEESVLRRFAFVLQFKPFNQKQRITLWHTVLTQNNCQHFLTGEDIEKLARQYTVSTGIVDLAVKKALELHPSSKDEFYNALILGIKSHQTVLNGGRMPQKGKDSIEESYSLEGLNIQGDINALINQVEAYDRYLKNFKDNQTMRIGMNILFWGLPGTGKSETSRYIAQHLKRELITKRGSDIINPFVGMTEKNISDAFSKAEGEGAVLVIDEVDTFLSSRDRAVRTWEVSSVNEFLTQMERFRGILICTTNRLEDLDAASIRRFNFKLGFNYLSSEGNIIFYNRLLATLIKTPVDDDAMKELKGISDLAPGDFRVVRDRHMLIPIQQITHDRLVSALQEEVKMKHMHSKEKTVGFKWNQ